MEEQIVGVLHFHSKYKFGTNAKRAEYFLFKPLSKKHDSYLVASSVRERANQYAIISFLKWDKSKSKLPYGQLVRLIGPCDDLNNTYDAIIYKHHLTTLAAKCSREPLCIDSCPRREVCGVFSVDPVGCQDIDDALSYNDDIVGIHIADVSAYFAMYDIQVKNYSSIYAPHRTYNMIPDKFAQLLCSLKPGERRFAFSVFAKIGPDGQVLESWFEKTIVKSSKAYDYDELQQLIHSGSAGQSETQLYKLGQLLGDNAAYDTHKMVENYMILANKLVGKFLFERAPPNTAIFRVHEAKLNHQHSSNVSQEINDILTLLESKAAVYTTKDSASNYYQHAGLGIQYYTHFTSPIRRYVDVYIHRLLHAVMLGIPDTVQLPDVNAINEYERNMKRAQREFNKIRLATTLTDENGTEIDGTIIEMNDKAICIYFATFKIVHWVNLVDKRFQSLVKIELGRDADSLIINGVIRLTKFQTIRVKLSSTMYNDEIHKKVSISIPVVDELLFKECIETQH
jgi:ribonuclease R